MTSVSATFDLDETLWSLGGLGRFQKKRLALLTLGLLSACISGGYIFTAAVPDYRCLVPECDQGSTLEYHPQWLHNAVPFKDRDVPEKCVRYKSVFADNNGAYCVGSMFNRSETEECHEFVFATERRSIAQDFAIYCDSNLWKLTTIGTIHNIGTFLGAPTMGALADWLGRKQIFAFGTFSMGLMAGIKSFSPNYWTFAALELVGAFMAGALFTTFFTLTMEQLPSAKIRVYTTSVLTCAATCGDIIHATIAWQTMSWRNLLRIGCLPSIFIYTYIWYIPDSIRWLLAKRRYSEVNQILKNIGEENGIVFSEKCQVQENTSEKLDEESGEKLGQMLRSPALVCRIFICVLGWISCAFLFTGITLTSVFMFGNIHLNVIMMALVEIPGFLFAGFSIEKFGRRITMCGLFIVTAFCCATIVVIPDGHWTRFALYLVAKSAATSAFSTIYIFTAELFPTPLRQTTMGFCSMCARLGSIIAPQMPLLTLIWKYMPTVAFSVFALFAGVLMLLLPETKNKKLPDTIEEALDLRCDNTKL